MLLVLLAYFPEGITVVSSLESRLFFYKYSFYITVEFDKSGGLLSSWLDDYWLAPLRILPPARIFLQCKDSLVMMPDNPLPQKLLKKCWWWFSAVKFTQINHEHLNMLKKILHRSEVHLYYVTVNSGWCYHIYACPVCTNCIIFFNYDRVFAFSF